VYSDLYTSPILAGSQSKEEDAEAYITKVQEEANRLMTASSRSGTPTGGAARRPPPGLEDELIVTRGSSGADLLGTAASLSENMTSQQLEDLYRDVYGPQHGMCPNMAAAVVREAVSRPESVFGNVEENGNAASLSHMLASWALTERSAGKY
jgi:hypothetical protein